MAQCAFAASSAEPVSSNGWFKSGDVAPNIYRIENGSKVLYASGLADAYYDTDHNQDRCLENKETCSIDKEYDEEYPYKNLMIQHNEILRANDLEMILKAYNNFPEGEPYFNEEYYKDQKQYYTNGTYKDEKASDAIKNTKDGEVNYDFLKE